MRIRETRRKGFMTPTQYFLARGASEGEFPLTAFDGALRAAGLGDVNIVKLSSIIPPGAQCVQHPVLAKGAVVGVAYASTVSTQPGITIAAAVAIAHPKTTDDVSVIMEYAGEVNQKTAGEIARRMAEAALIARKLVVDRCDVLSVQHTVNKCGCAIAAVVEL